VAAESRADFIHKYAIAQKEARECDYRLLHAGLIPVKKLAPLIAETNELIVIVTTILVKLKRRK
jgi:four helix bundle protein